MNKEKQSLVCIVVLLSGLCLPLTSACALEAPAGAKVQEVEVSASTIAPMLGVVVDKEKRVIEVASGFDYYLGKDMGIQVGDTVVAINEMPVVLDDAAIVELRRSFNGASEVSVRVLRSGEEVVLTSSLDKYYAGIEEQYERLEEIEAMFEAKTKAEVEAIIEEAGAPVAPESLPPTPTPIPEDLYFL